MRSLNISLILLSSLVYFPLTTKFLYFSGNYLRLFNFILVNPAYYVHFYQKASQVPVYPEFKETVQIQTRSQNFTK